MIWPLWKMKSWMALPEDQFEWSNMACYLLPRSLWLEITCLAPIWLPIRSSNYQGYPNHQILQRLVFLFFQYYWWWQQHTTSLSSNNRLRLGKRYVLSRWYWHQSCLSWMEAHSLSSGFIIFSHIGYRQATLLYNWNLLSSYCGQAMQHVLSLLGLIFYNKKSPNMSILDAITLVKVKAPSSYLLDKYSTISIRFRKAQPKVIQNGKRKP